MKNFSSFFSLSLLLSTQPLPIAANAGLSPVEAEILKNSSDESYIDLSRDRSKLAELAAEISSWDEDKNSPICQLNKHIENGYVIALKDAVLETLAYAESVVEKQADKLSRDQLDQINNSLNVLAHEIEDGDLLLDVSDQDLLRDPIIKIREKMYVLDRAKFFDGVTFKKDVKFKDDVTIEGTLSAADAVIGCDISVGCNISMVDSTSSSVGNVIKNGSRFIHNFGTNNTFVGKNAGNFTTTSVDSVGIGTESLSSNTTGSYNTAVGSLALNSNTIGSYNTAVGRNTLAANTISSYNTAVGYNALLLNVSGAGGNTAVGYSTLASNTAGDNCTAVGYQALLNNTTGEHNVGIGGVTLTLNTTGKRNTALGYNGLASNITGSYSTAVGHESLVFATGDNNIALGYQAGFGCSGLGSNNIYIGNSGLSESNAIRIGVQGTQQLCSIAGIYGATSTGGVAVFVNGSGQLGTVTSSKRFKHDINVMANDSADIYQLNPVTFVYNEDASETKQYGLIAEEVDQVFPAIVVKDEDGSPYTVQYHVLPVLLLNELIKQHAAIEKQSAVIEKQVVDFASAMEDINNRLVVLEQQN